VKSWGKLSFIPYHAIEDKSQQPDVSELGFEGHNHMLEFGSAQVNLQHILGCHVITFGSITLFVPEFSYLISSSLHSFIPFMCL